MAYDLDLNKVSKMTHNRDFPKVSKIYLKKCFVHSIKMLNSLKDLDLSSEELKEIAKILAKKEVLKAIKACLKINY